MLRSLLTILAFATVLETHSQYILKWNDVFRYLETTRGFRGESLGPMLLDGYLRGKIKAYDFSVGHEDLKWMPAPKEDWPSVWDPDFDYYTQTERVTWKGKFYQAKRDVVKNRKTDPQTNTQDWSEYELRGKPVSTRYWFPTEKDTTSKEEFLSQFNMSVWPGYASPWDVKTEYLSHDIVMYKELFYQCSIDNLNKRPGQFPNIWQQVETSIGFSQPDDLAFFSILYAVDGKQTIPQMLSLYLHRPNGEVIHCPGLNFKYQDVCTYLADLKTMPLICEFPFGYTGMPQLIDPPEALVELLQSSLRSGKLKPNGNDILQKEEYELFLRYSLNVPRDVSWYLHQDMNSNEITMRVSYPGNDGSDILKLHWKDVEPLIQATGAKPKTTTYLDWLNSFTPARIDTLSIDSLAPLPYRPVTAPLPSKAFFISEHRSIAKNNPATASAMQALWIAMKNAVAEKQIEVVWGGLPDLFPCDQPFPQVTLKYGDKAMTLDPGYNFNPAVEIKIDSADHARPVSGVRVQYTRSLKPTATRSFEPYKVAFVLGDSDDASWYYFHWEDIVATAKGREEFKSLVDAIVTGNLVVKWTTVAEDPVASR